jgi:outer membrane protein assembly factor BamD
MRALNTITKLAQHAIARNAARNTAPNAATGATEAMIRKIGNVVRIAACGAALAVVAACHGLPEKTDETATWNNNKLYTEAQDALSSGDWSKCAKYFESLEGRDPFGHFAQQAQINVAYCSWKDGENDAADEAIDRFIRLHPDHPDIAYAYYLKGMIHFNDDLGLFGRFSGQDMSERDPKSLREAYDAFKQVVDKYPQSKYAPDSAQRMRYIVNALASHEVHVADYYYRRGAYVAAINRAQLTITQYKSAPAIEDALHIMILSYQKLDQPQLADDTRRVLASTFPDSPYITGHARPSNGNSSSKAPWWQLW